MWCYWPIDSDLHRCVPPPRSSSCCCSPALIISSTFRRKIINRKCQVDGNWRQFSCSSSYPRRNQVPPYILRTWPMKKGNHSTENFDCIAKRLTPLRSHETRTRFWTILFSGNIGYTDVFVSLFRQVGFLRIKTLWCKFAPPTLFRVVSPYARDHESITLTGSHGNR